MHRNSLSATLTGFALAVLLTAIPFAAVGLDLASGRALASVIAVSAVLQILVHLRFFLGVRLRGGSRENLYALAFTAVLLGLMVGGTFWIMSNLSARMAPEAPGNVAD